MADNGFNGERQFPYPLIKDGKGYNRAVQSRAQAILNSLMGFLPSNYRASIASPEYSYYLRGMAVELAKLTFGLEQLSDDISFEEVRPEFLYQTVAYLLFTDGDLPGLDVSDEEFRDFLLKIIEIYFQGSTPQSVIDAVELFTDETFTVRENFEEARSEGSTLDISDQFGFSIEFDLSSGVFPEDLFEIQKNINLLIQIIKPAHTLYRLAHVFTDEYTGPSDDDTVLDELNWTMHDRRYDDARKYCKGISGWSSSTGYAELGSLNILRDDAETSPMSSIREGARVTILSGENSAVYRVAASLDDNSVQVTPRLKVPETNISYKTEVDRLGYKREVQVTSEDASSQFISPLLLEVSMDGPYTVAGGSDFTATASSNFEGDMTYEWEFGDGDFDYNDGTGSSVTFTAPVGPSERLIRVKGTSADGRVKVAQSTVTIT